MGKSIRSFATVITRVGQNLAKRALQVHAVDANGEIVVARKLVRAQLIQRCRRAWWRWRRAPRRIIGGGR